MMTFYFESRCNKYSKYGFDNETLFYYSKLMHTIINS